MITEKEVRQAIDECTQEPITGSKRSTLADLIIIQDYLFGEPRQEKIKYVEVPVPAYFETAEKQIMTNGGSEFLEAVNGRNADKVWKVIDELIDATRVLHPRMYRSFIEKICEI